MIKSETLAILKAAISTKKIGCGELISGDDRTYVCGVEYTFKGKSDLKLCQKCRGSTKNEEKE